MPSTYQPYGLKPYFHPSGTIRNEVGSIASGYATSIYQYAPIQIVAGTNTIGAAAAGARALGTFMGCVYTPSGQRPVFSPYWPASQAASDIVAYYTSDPAIQYEIQANAAMPSGKGIGSELDWTTNGSSNGNTTTGASTVGADISSIAPQGNAGLRIVGYGREVDNAASDDYPNLIVQISEHQNVADRAGYGSTT